MNIQKTLDLHGKWLRGEAGGVRANLRYCDLRDCDLSGSNLRGSNLRDCDLRDCDLRGSDLSGSNLRDCDLSGSTGLISQQTYMQEHFEHDRRGFIVYKTFNSQYSAPAGWVSAPGSVIEEVVNPNRTDDCGCGVNVATLEWVKKKGGRGDIWKCRIAWKDAPGIVVPYSTDGKIRAERVELVEVMPR